MRVLFLTHPPETPSTRTRVLPYLPLLERDGVAADAVVLPDGMAARWRLFRRAGDYDAVLLQKRLLPAWQARMLRRHARRLVYDFDDPMPYRRKDEGRVERSGTREGRFRAILALADVVIANHAGTAELARAYGARTVGVIPTPVDLARWRPKTSWTTDGRPVFGWIGTRSNLYLLRAAAPALSGRRLRIVADATIDLPGVDVEFVPWEEEREADWVRSFDIGLAPLADDDWNRWKMPYKIITCLASAVPVIASRLGAVETVIRDGENGILAGSWADAAERLERDAVLRERLGREGRRTAESLFALDRCYTALRQALALPAF